jgi:Ca-activated chloride channel homolog
MKTFIHTLAFLFSATALGCGDTTGGQGGPDAGGWSTSDSGAWGSPDGGPGGGGNIGLGGAGDFGYFRRLLDDGIVPTTDDFDAAGFFHEHHLTLPPPSCGQRVCLQAMLGVMNGLTDAKPYSMLHLGLNTPVTIDPEQRPPLTLAVVVDVSGSMASAGKIDFVRQGLATLIEDLGDDDRLALVTYSSTAQVVAAMGPVGGRRASLLAIAEGLVASGGTNLYAGLELGYQQVQAVYDLERQNRVIMLSDGMPTTGTTDDGSILDMSAGYNAEGLGVTTIGLGTDFNPLLMRGLAEQGHGNHYFLENSSAVQEVFVEELDYFAVPVAFDVSLAVKEGSHYGFGQAYGSSFWTDQPGGGALEVPSVFLAHRVSDDDVFDGDAGTPGRRGGGSALLVRLVPNAPTPPPEDDQAAVAIVDVSFREPGSTELVSDQVVVNHPFWQDGPPAAGYVDSPDPANTHKVLVMLELYRAIEFACATFHVGQGTDGLRALMRIEAAVIDYNEEIGDLDMTYDLALVAKLMEVMIANGAVPPDDPGIPDDPWPAD